MTEDRTKKTLSIKFVPDHIQKLQMLKIQKIEEIKKTDEKALPLFKKPAVSNALEWLYETFPKCFTKREQQPIKINILDDIFIFIEQSSLNETAPSKRALKAALATYARNRFYLKSCTDGANRIDLDGNPVSVVLSTEAEYAKAMYEKFNAVFKEKKKKQQKRNKPFQKK
jgi:ProP effector